LKLTSKLCGLKTLKEAKIKKLAPFAVKKIGIWNFLKLKIYHLDLIKMSWVK